VEFFYHDRPPPADLRPVHCSPLSDPPLYYARQSRADDPFYGRPVPIEPKVGARHWNETKEVAVMRECGIGYQPSHGIHFGALLKAMESEKGAADCTLRHGLYQQNHALEHQPNMTFTGLPLSGQENARS